MNQPATGAFTEYLHTVQMFGAASCESRLPLATVMEMARREVILAALDANRWHQIRTAHDLGMPRNTLIANINRLRITRPKVTCAVCGAQTPMRYSRDHAEVWPRKHRNQRGGTCPGAYRPCKKPAASELQLNEEKQA